MYEKIQQCRKKWSSHVERMNETRLPKMILNLTLRSKKPQNFCGNITPLAKPWSVNYVTSNNY